MGGGNVGKSVKGAVHNLFGYKPATKEEQKEFVNENRKSILIRGNNKFKNVTLEDFQIQAVIGRGTFGKVFLAEFSRTGQQYAIKTIRKDIANYECFEDKPEIFIYGCFSVLISTTMWLFLASYFEDKVSFFVFLNSLKSLGL